MRQIKMITTKLENLTHGRRARPSGRKLVEHIRGRATAKMSTDEILTLTRGD